MVKKEKRTEEKAGKTGRGRKGGGEGSSDRVG